MIAARDTISTIKFVLGLLTATTIGWGQAPSALIFQQVLEKQLLALRPTGATERQVLFEEVKSAAKNGNAYPFSVTGVIRDYGPGYPANRFYGETCIGKMEGWIFQLTRNAMGDWQAEGRMTPTGNASKCEKNPAAGVSSIPLASLNGTRAAATPVAGAGRAAGPAELHLGQWACYGTGGRWNRDLATATVAFPGGRMDGQIGKDVKGQGMRLTNTVNCEPWR